MSARPGPRRGSRAITVPTPIANHPAGEASTWDSLGQWKASSSATDGLSWESMWSVSDA